MSAPPSALLADLRAAAGDDAVRTDPADTFAYRRDLWPRLTLLARDGLPEVAPLAVVRPADEPAVERVVAALRRHGTAVVPYGAGSGVCGGAAPLFGGVVVDLKRLDRLERVDAGALQVTVGPGLILQTLEERLNDAGWTLGHFPSSILCCSIGGCVAARGAGQLSSRYGKIEDMVTGLRVVTADLGTLRTGSLDPAGPAVDWSPLFLGSEGTYGLITAVRLRVHPLPSTLMLRGVQFPSVDAGIAGFREILQMGLRPSVMRLYDPLDTFMALQKSDEPGGARPRPGSGYPLDVPPPAAHENATEPAGPPPADAGTRRVFGMVLSPGSLTDEALSLLGRLPGLGGRDRRAAARREERDGGRRAEDAPSGWGGALVKSLAARLLGDDAGDRLRPENLPLDRLLGHAPALNRAISLLPGRSLAILGCEGDDAVAAAQLQAAVLAAGRLGGRDLGPGPGERWFRKRYHVSFKLPKLLATGAWADTFETAAPWTAVPRLYAAVKRAASPHALVMAHFSHAYHEGCSIYFTLAGHAPSPAERLRGYETTWTAILQAAHDAGATITHHHGVGFLKRHLMDAEHGAGRWAFEAGKRAVDGGRILNPGKLFPDALPLRGPSAPAPAPRALVVHGHEDGVVEAGVDWRGVDLAAELHLRGHWLAPLGRDFLDGTVGDWLRGGALAAHVAVHGAWEHPVQAVCGRLPDGRFVRSARLPRSAAGPSWLPLFVAGLVAADRVTLRTQAEPPLRHVGFAFPTLPEAIAATRGALRGASARPLGGAILPGADRRGLRDLFDAAPDVGGVVYLTLPWPDEFHAGADQIAERLARAGGRARSDEDALAFWEEHWGQPHREGAAALAATGPRPDERDAGEVAAVVGFGKAALLLRAVETLTGGATMCRGAIEAPLETGCTIRWRFRTSRPGTAVPALVPHQVGATIASFGGRVARWSFPRVQDGGARPPSPSDSGRLEDALRRGLLEVLA